MDIWTFKYMQIFARERKEEKKKVKQAVTFDISELSFHFGKCNYMECE